MRTLIALLLLAQPALAQEITFNGKPRKYVVRGKQGRKPVGVVVGLHCNGGTPVTESVAPVVCSWLMRAVLLFTTWIIWSSEGVP